ncbi:SAM-dependent methyltransferase [Amycolatopsis sp. NPDC006131]|uniref:SAM-dependent methyltransferase n=1 Tax=Amycolatopsis sp. NPDC006131 TaxID=3156731 RepID=UPI0033B29E64
MTYGPRCTTDRATCGGVYDIHLGGSGYTRHDREAARRMVAEFPAGQRDVPERAARFNRQFLVRSVGYALDQGIRQFLDLGCGFPRWGNVHEVAQPRHPDARVVYVDYELGPVEEYRKLLSGNGNTHVLHADLREPERVLDQAAERLDLGEPVWLGMLCVLSFVRLCHGEDLYDVVRQYTDRLAPGSCFTLSIGCGEDMPAESLPPFYLLSEVYERELGTPYVLRNVSQVERFFDGLSLVTPVTYLTDCLAEPGRQVSYTDWAKRAMRGAVARVPG